ncbi:MAG: trehalose-6-phosphate synthase, partial [Candidatus Eisenbacteria bacterium]
DAFAAAVAEAARPSEQVLVHDYQLALVPGMVRKVRPDLRVAHFTHTPFCGPNSIRVLPTDVALDLCSSMNTVPCGFHTSRWARAYEASAAEILGTGTSLTPAFSTPLGPDPSALAELAASDATALAAVELDELVGDRKLILRSDRIDLSKNIVRGFVVFDHLLAQHPEWCGRVVFVAMLNRSRESLAEYLAYEREVEQAAAQVNERRGTSDWQPIVVDTRDDYEQTIAGFARYDVLLVNPVKDGLNLVAKEGPLVNARDGVLVLSPEAGAYDELHEAVVPIHPYDIEQGAAALHTALSMPADLRAARASRLRELALVHSPQTWLRELLARAR